VPTQAEIDKAGNNRDQSENQAKTCAPQETASMSAPFHTP